jgi:hypothetical protein
MREPVGKLLLVAATASLAGMCVGFAASSARAYHTYEERLLDGTAYSLHRREARLGLMQLSYGILDQLQVTTYTLPWILAPIFEDVVPNVELKSTFYDKRKLALSASVALFTGTIQQIDNTKIRYFIIPIGVTASVRLNSDVSVHTGGTFTATDFTGVAEAGGADVEGAVVVNLLQLSATIEWRTSRVTAFTLTTRWIPYVSDSVLQGTIDIDENTGGTIEAEVDTDALMNAWAIIPGVVFSGARANFRLGVGYGSLFLPGIGLVVPGLRPRSGTPTPVLDFDVFVRF